MEKNENKGFNIIELLVTLAVAATLASLAIPSFRWMVQNNRVVTTTNSLVSALQIARSEAIKQGVEIDVVSRTGDWQAGWRVGLDLNDDGDFDDADEAVLQSWDALAEGVTVSMADPAVHYRPNGRADSAAVFVVSPQDCPSGQLLQRQVGVALTGQVNSVPVACP